MSKVLELCERIEKLHDENGNATYRSDNPEFAFQVESLNKILTLTKIIRLQREGLINASSSSFYAADCLEATEKLAGGES